MVKTAQVAKEIVDIGWIDTLVENAAAVSKWVVDHAFQNVGISSVAGHRQIRNGANPGSGLAPTIVKLVAPRPGRGPL